MRTQAAHRCVRLLPPAVRHHAAALQARQSSEFQSENERHFQSTAEAQPGTHPSMEAARAPRGTHS